MQRERNCSYYDRCSSAEREKLQLLRPLQHIERNCSYFDRFSRAERETAAITAINRRGEGEGEGGGLGFRVYKQVNIEAHNNRN